MFCYILANVCPPDEISVSEEISTKTTPKLDFCELREIARKMVHIAECTVHIFKMECLKHHNVKNLNVWQQLNFSATRS